MYGGATEWDLADNYDIYKDDSKIIKREIAEKSPYSIICEKHRESVGEEEEHDDCFDCLGIHTCPFMKETGDDKTLIQMYKDAGTTWSPRVSKFRANKGIDLD